MTSFPMGLSTAMETNDETTNVNEPNMVKNPNWEEADQLAIFNCDHLPAYFQIYTSYYTSIKC